MLKEEPILFSVVIPLYNKEAEIVSTINSVLDQTLSSFEIIIVNDGSTDRSLEVVTGFKDERLRVVDKINEGVSVARNVGIFLARGNYIALLDGDDIWHEDFLMEIKLLIDKFEGCKVFGTNYSISANTHNQGLKSNQLLIDNYFELAMYMPLLTSSSIVIDRSCFDNEMRFNSQFTHGEDLDLWLRLILKYKYIGYSERKLMSYIHTAANRSFAKLPIPEKHFAYYFDLKSEKQSIVKRYYLQQVVMIMRAYLKHIEVKYFFQFAVRYKWNWLEIIFGIVKNTLNNQYKIAARTK